MTARHRALSLLTNASVDDAYVVAVINGGELAMITAAPRGAAEMVTAARSLLSTAVDMLIQEESDAETDEAAEPIIELRLAVDDALDALPDADADDD